MTEKIKKFIRDNQLIKKNVHTVAAAVSGGVDSCVLLHLLLQLRRTLGIELQVIHFNHKTRQGESDRDQDFVSDLAEKYALKIDVGIRSDRTVKISETALRQARYDFFDRFLAGHPHCLIATGHNRDDQSETFLMRLAKGSGLKGLLSIRPSRDGYIRPLLCLSRAEILRYAESNQLVYRHDRSNEDITIQRNRLRRQIVPYLKQHLDRDLDRNLGKVIKNLAFYQQLYQDKLTEAVISAVKISGNRVMLSRKRYPAFNEVIRRGLIEYCISKRYLLNYIISDRNFQRWDLFIGKAQSGRQYQFLPDARALAERDQIVFGKRETVGESRHLLQIGGEVSVDEKTKISWIKSRPQEVVMDSNRRIEFVDGDKCGASLFVRFWQSGDRFKPLGMKNNRKLSDFFTDLKLASDQKIQVPLVCSDEQIIWVAGYRISEDVKITKQTKLFYRLELKKEK
jgi:tRNA(Ile)-lysidine synthase